MQTASLLPLVKAVEKATGHRPHLSTVLRWCLKPNRYGNQLQSSMVGGRRMTTVQAVLDYNAANTDASTSTRLTSSVTELQSSGHNAAIKMLESEGV